MREARLRFARLHFTSFNFNTEDEVMSELFITRMFATIDARRWSELADFFTADAIYERPGYAPIIGFPALDHFYRDVRIIVAGQHRIERMMGGRETAACWGRFVGAGKDGKPLDERFADVYELRDGRVARRTSYFFRPAI
jgi:ketosteroid isomerase-like protein